jgi:hypothetical protein
MLGCVAIKNTHKRKLNKREAGWSICESPSRSSHQNHAHQRHHSPPGVKISIISKSAVAFVVVMVIISTSGIGRI